MDDSECDARMMCKYGRDCYQKNPEHRKKFKHPKRDLMESDDNEPKKRKVDLPAPKIMSDERKVPTTNPGNNISDQEGITKAYLDIPSDLPSRIETVFLVKMPSDFFSFFDFCKSLNNNNPHVALESAGLKLVGAFDLIEKDLKRFTLEEGLRHFRYFYDPPEFQTVLSCDNKEQLHYGYFRDSPKDMPSFVASNGALSGCSIEIVGDNLFSALHKHLEKMKKMSDPFRKIKLQKIHQALTDWSSKYNYKIDTYAKTNRERKNKMTAKTFHGAGIVVPYDKKTELGYRELKENDKNLKSILQDLCGAKTEEERRAFWTKLQPVITYANIANDECDFGTSLELGIDLFCFGDALLHKSVLNILSTSYELLGRNEFITILKAHLENRMKNINDLNTIVK